MEYCEEMMSTISGADQLLLGAHDSSRSGAAGSTATAIYTAPVSAAAVAVAALGGAGMGVGESAGHEQPILSKLSTTQLSTSASEPLVSHTDFQRGRFHRLALSSSLDVDIRLPYYREVRGQTGLHLSTSRSIVLKNTSAHDHQSLLVSSLLMGDDNLQKSKVEFKRIRFYTAMDVALGQFLIENCFQFQHAHIRDSSMLDHCLSFSHRLGRLEVKVRKLGGASADSGGLLDDLSSPHRDPRTYPIQLYSYCKECQKVVTPEVVMSDETWKMSFGKFMEISFYNRSARCRTGNCTHCVRDNHSLFFVCENYEARFDFIQMHPYALHMRAHMDFPNEVHDRQAKLVLQTIPEGETGITLLFGAAVSLFRCRCLGFVLFGCVDVSLLCCCAAALYCCLTVML